MIEPLQTAPATLFVGKVKNKLGTLVLLPDRIAFVESKARWGAAFGALGMLLAQRSAAKRAPARAAEGGDGVTTVPLRSLRAIELGQQGLNKNVLVLDCPDGPFKIGVKYDKWAPAISTAAQASGRTCTSTGDRVDFA